MSTPREVLKRQLTRSQPCMSTPGESLKRQLTRSQPLSGTTPREVLKRQVTRSHQVDVPIFIAFNLYMPYWEFQIEHAIRSINEAFSEFQQRHRPIDVGMSIPKEVLKRQLTRSLPFMSTPREALKKQLTRSQPCLSTPEESLKRQLTRSQISKIEGLARADLGTNRYSSIPFYQHQFIHELGHHQVDVPIFMAFNLYMPYWEFEIKHAIRSINEAVPGLHLYLTTDTYDYKIKITGEDEDDVYTEGNIILDREVIINLGRNFSDSEEQRRSTATHELMHALGVKHEHQRLDANQFVSYRRHSIHLSPRPHYYGLTAFDPMSIMMYSERDINRRGDAYIWMLKPCKDRELKMSELDKVGLNLLYKPAVNGSYNPRYNDKGLWNIYYCGRTFKQQDGTTGECGNITGGPTCPACRVLRCDALDSLVQNGKWQGWTGLVYCGRKFSNPSSDHDGYCGPNRGPQCPGCLFYPLSAYL